MKEFARLLHTSQVEFWGKWVARAFSVVIIPFSVFLLSYIKTELLVYGNEHFAPKAGFIALEKTVQTNHTENILLKQELKNIRETLNEIKTDVRELRGKK